MMDIARRVAHPHVVEPRHERTASENDLTVRLKHAEEALRARELNFQMIVESIPAPVAVITPTGQVEALNQPVLDYLPL
jgi:PAS domain-containing protein